MNLNELVSSLNDYIKSAEDRGNKKTSKYLKALKDVLENSDEKSRQEILNTYIHQINSEINTGRTQTFIAIVLGSLLSCSLLIFLWFFVLDGIEVSRRKRAWNEIKQGINVRLENSSDNKLEARYNKEGIKPEEEENLKQLNLFDETLGNLEFRSTDDLVFSSNLDPQSRPKPGTLQFSVKTPQRDTTLGVMTVQRSGGYINRPITLSQDEPYEAGVDGNMDGLSLSIKQESNTKFYTIEICKDNGENCKTYNKIPLVRNNEEVRWGPATVQFPDDSSFFIIVMYGNDLEWNSDGTQLKGVSDFSSNAIRVIFKE